MGRVLRLSLLAIFLIATSARAAGEVHLWKWVDGERISVDELPPAPGVSNPVLSVLVSLVDLDLYGRVSQARLRRAAEEGGDEKIPWEYLLWVKRSELPAVGHPEIQIRFLAEMSLPIPYAFLGYHPGSVKASQLVELDEWKRGDWSMRWMDGDQERRVQVQDLSLFAVREGSLGIDVDAWVDWVMGGKLDDIRITGMALFRQDDHRYAMAFGYNPDGKGRTGVLDLLADEILFPPSTAFRALGRQLRSEAEARSSQEARSVEGSTPGR